MGEINYRTLSLEDNKVVKHKEKPTEVIESGSVVPLDEKEARLIGYDTWANSLYGLPYPLYFYIYSRKAFGSEAETFSIPMGNCPTIQNVQYAPYFYWSDFVVRTINYDNARFGDVDPLRPQPSTNPLVYRIVGMKNEMNNKYVGSFSPFENLGQAPGHKQPRNWRNESRLHQYPYRRIYLIDGFNQPFEVKSTLLKFYKNNHVYVKTTLSDRMSYSIYVKDYKNDTDGKMEALVSGDSIELPSSSSYYSQWLATSKNSTAVGVKQQISQSLLNTTQGISANNLMIRQQGSNVKMDSLLGFTGGLFNGIKTSLTTGRDFAQASQRTSLQNSQSWQTHNMLKRHAIESAIATSQDASTTPPTMLSMGSDFVYGYLNNDKSLKSVIYTMNDINAQKIGDYFSLYGYKQNKILYLSGILRTRYYYNYIKTENAKVTSKNNVPREHINEINAIFDNGCTFWHIDREGVKFGEYKYDNAELWI